MHGHVSARRLVEAITRLGHPIRQGQPVEYASVNKELYTLACCTTAMHRPYSASPQ
jgi:hypothetical protein